jgi:ribonuclease PH
MFLNRYTEPGLNASAATALYDAASVAICDAAWRTLNELMTGLTISISNASTVIEMKKLRV